jgi:DNA-binding MarR family transcriptional regulator
LFLARLRDVTGSPQHPTGSRLGDIQRASYLLHVMAERQQAHYAACAAEFGLTGAQAKVLMSLEPGQSLPMHSLAQRARSDPSNFTGLADKLEARGALRREADPSDRRVKMLALTEAGRRLREAFWDRLTGDPGPIAPLTADQVGQLCEILSAALGPSTAP